MEILLVFSGYRSEVVGTDRLLGCDKKNTGVEDMKFVSKFFKDESGATAIEYGLIAALIAVVIIGAVTALGTGVSTNFSTVAGAL